MQQARQNKTMILGFMFARRVFFVAALLLCWGAAAFFSFSKVYADDISFEATVDSDAIPLGTAGQLVLTVYGTHDLDNIPLPVIDGIDLRYVGPSTQVSVVNGQYSTSKSFTYMLIPVQEGAFTIPSIQVDIKGKAYSSQPILLRVSSADPKTVQEQDPLSDPQSLADKVRMTIHVPRTKCFVNEELPLAIRLYVQDVPLQDITLPDIRQEGFVLSDYARPRQFEETVDGRRFQVVEFLTRLTPLRPGALSVGPALLQANLVVRSNSSRNSSGARSIFGEDLFSTIFGGHEKRPITITAPPFRVDVADLPIEGVPRVFSGAVGKFTFDVEVSPDKVKVGDPLTLRMIVAGTGNLQGIVMPSFKSDDFKVYEPRIREEGGRKVLEQVLIPVREDISSVPAIDFSYFDVGAENYQTITRGPFPVEVSPLEQGQEFRAIGFSDRAQVLLKEDLGKDIVFIKDHPGSWAKRGSVFEREAVFFSVLFFYVSLWIAALVFLLHYRRLSSDAFYARRAVVYREFRKAWKEASLKIREGQGREFYDVLTGIVRGYLTTKLGIPSGQISALDIQDALRDAKIDSRQIRKLTDMLNVADEVVFGGRQASIKDMQRDHLDAEEVIEAIERRAR